MQGPGTYFPWRIDKPYASAPRYLTSSSRKFQLATSENGSPGVGSYHIDHDPFVTQHGFTFPKLDRRLQIKTEVNDDRTVQRRKAIPKFKLWFLRIIKDSKILQYLNRIEES